MTPFRSRTTGREVNVVARYGVAGATHRRIAETAGVPLGSMTYYFDGIDDLLKQAFTHFSIQVS